jgi:hypothetical protein
MLVEWVLGAARAQPLTIALEDLHWADASTLELIQLLAEQGPMARLLLLCTARPEFHPQWPLRAHHTQINLNRLSARNVREMITQMAARNALASETVETVIERTGGVPLFVEELTRAVLESGSGKLAGHEIPVTLHDSLMARLDRLGPAKEIIQIGAVIGGEFSYELLHAVHPVGKEELQTALRSATDAELVYVRGIAPEATYQFKHELIQYAAYEALLKSRRKELHGLVARTINDKFPALKQAHPEVLARHWTEADETERAMAEWTRAGNAAEMRNAFSEALASYYEALALLKLMPESSERDARELALWQAALLVLVRTRGTGAPETLDAAACALALAKKTGNLTQLAGVMIIRGSGAVELGDILAASAFADEALALALNGGDPATIKYARNLEIQVSYFGGNLANLEKHFAAGRDLFEQSGLGENLVTVTALGYASLSACYLGRAETARQRLAQLRRAARENNQWEMTWVELSAAVFHTLLGEYELAEQFALRALDLSEKFQFAALTMNSRVYLGYARAQLGQASEGIALISQGIAETPTIRTAGFARFFAFLAAAQKKAGAIEDALESIEQSLQVHPEVLITRSEAMRVHGELRLEKGQAELAKADFRDSIALARRMDAKTLELCSTVSLARLLASEGRPDEAHSILDEIYSWFTEGFDTPDLKDAKALLDQLTV